MATNKLVRIGGLKLKTPGGDYWRERDPSDYIRKLRALNQPVPSWVKSLKEQGAPEKYWKNLGGDSSSKNLGIAKKDLKKVALSTKKYNVKTSTSADAAPEVSASGILSGGGGGYSTEEVAGNGFSFSDIPSIVWIILAVGAGIFLIKSAKKGKR